MSAAPVCVAAPGAEATARAGAACGAAAEGGGAADGWALAAPVAASRVRIALPSLTLSPTLTLSSLTVPATGAGTSMVALSDSSVTSESSAFTTSPGLTNTSMTGTSLKSPMSGTLTSIVLMVTFLFGGAQRHRKTPLVLSLPRPHASRTWHHTVHGAGLATSMPYCLIACATVAAGKAPSSASAFSAATVT